MKVNKKTIIIVMIIIMLLASVSLIYILINKKNNQNNILIVEDEYIQINRNELSYQDNITIDELKDSVGLKGNTDIYEIKEEFDGRKTLVVKADLKYKVAFAGMIKKEKPRLDELQSIIDTNMPTENGIWVEENTRKKLLEILNGNKFNSKYSINNEGYLQIEEKNKQNDLDKKLERIIKGNKQYILDISSLCYIVDDVTGEIIDYNFEDIDRYQMYEYFYNNDKVIVFISQNTRGIYSDEEIIESVIEVVNRDILF